MNEHPSFTPRMVFLAVCFLAFVWIGLFIILPSMSGKPGVAQKMQSDLQHQNPSEDAGDTTGR